MFDFRLTQIVPLIILAFGAVFVSFSYVLYQSDMIDWGWILVAFFGLALILVAYFQDRSIKRHLLLGGLTQGDLDDLEEAKLDDRVGELQLKAPLKIRIFPIRNDSDRVLGLEFIEMSQGWSEHHASLTRPEALRMIEALESTSGASTTIEGNYMEISFERRRDGGAKLNHRSTSPGSNANPPARKMTADEVDAFIALVHKALHD